MNVEKISVFILIDALGWTYLNDSDFAPWLQFRRPLKTILGYSSGAIPSILTGKTPENHGQWNLLYLNKKKSPFRWVKPFKYLPTRCVENRYSRKIINVITKKVTKHEGYFSSYGVPTVMLPYFDLVEKKNIYKTGGIPGCESIFDYWTSKSIKYYSYTYHENDDINIIKILHKNIKEKKSSIHFAYLAEIDSFLHEKCKEKIAVKEKLEVYSQLLHEIFQTATDRYDEVNFFIFSDHGMTPVYHTLDLRKIIESSSLQLGIDYFAVYDSTMARFWAKNDVSKNEILQLLYSCENGTVLNQNMLNEFGLNFTDNRYGDIIYLLNPGTVIAPNFISSYIPSGMHGFHPNDQFSYGSYLSNKGTHTPNSIIDLMSIFKQESSV
ncbi:alkaline phosphatase family protein [Desulfogranum marinum]|uniref:alkaline phosphatase family protein n=1 Tax=Desulfogranum marinum TaxID=453220 RepID=UPI0029C7F19B|nr:alkaline phosphatase family protein [Desulfogranum marinum]